MKRFTKTMKCVAMMFSLCMLFVLSVTSEAATAKYLPNVTYVNPEINSKNEYYSNLKLRMETYADETVRVVYPKDAAISVSTNKKALEAMVTYRSNENITGENGKKVYATPNLSCFYDSNVGEYVYYDANIGRYYYLDGSYDDNYNWVETPVYLESVYAPVLDEDGDSYRRTCTYDATTNAYYYTKYMYDVNDNYVETKLQLTPDKIDWICYYVDGQGNETRLYKDSKGYYYCDYSITVYENSQTVVYDDGVTPDYEYALADIKLTSTKKGTYKVNVTVNGVTTTLKVYVTPYGNRTFTKVKLGDSTISSIKKTETSKNTTVKTVYNYQVKSSVKSGKLKLTANKGIKITGIITARLDKDGKVVYKKTKNGKKINLSQTYATTDRDSYTGNKGRSALKETYLYVSYKDTYLNTSYTYSIVKKHGDKQIKQVRKAPNGKKYTSYLDYGDYATMLLWSY